MTFVRFVGIVRRSVRFLVIVTVAGALLGVVAGLLTRHSSSAGKARDFYQSTQSIGVDPSGIPQVAIGQYGSLSGIGNYVTSDAVTQEVAGKVGGLAADLAKRVTTVVQESSNSVDIVVVGTEPDETEALAKAFGASLIDAYQRQIDASAGDQATALGKRLDDLKTQRQKVEDQLAAPGLSAVDRDTLEAQRDALINQYRITYDRFINLGSTTTSVSPLYPLNIPTADPIDKVAYEAALERGRTGTNHLKATGDGATATAAPSSGATRKPSGPIELGVLGAFLGFVLALGVVMVRDHFDRRVRAPEEFADAFAIPVVCGIPDIGRHERGRGSLVVVERPMSPAAEAFRTMRTSVLLLGEEHAQRRGALVVMVSSAQPREGKSTTAANLAATFAESGRSVLVVNCDFQRPTLHHIFGLEDRPGEVLSTSAPGALRVVTNVTGDARLPGQVAAEQRAFVDAQRTNYDVILLDTAPILSSSNPLELVPVADLVLLVGRVGVTRSDLAHQTVELLQRHRAALAGVVMIGVAPVSGDYYYAYGEGALGRSPLPVRAAEPATLDPLPEPAAPVPPAASEPAAPAAPEPGASEPAGPEAPASTAPDPSPAPAPPARTAGTSWSGGSAQIRWVEVGPDAEVTEHGGLRFTSPPSN